MGERTKIKILILLSAIIGILFFVNQKILKTLIPTEDSRAKVSGSQAAGVTVDRAATGFIPGESAYTEKPLLEKPGTKVTKPDSTQSEKRDIILIQ